MAPDKCFTKKDFQVILLFIYGPWMSGVIFTALQMFCLNAVAIEKLQLKYS